MSQNLWVLIGKGIAKKIHCCFAVFILLTFVGAAHAAGYTCQSSKRFTSCNTGYYISNCPTSSSSWTGQTISSSALTTGNSCKSCPSGYSCSGGLVCPRKSTITIILNKNGGSGDIGTGTAIVGGRLSATITCTAGAACALPEWSSDVSASAKNTNITNGKKVFVGWATTSTATAGSFTIKSTTNRTLYAVWKTPTCSATNGTCTIQNASENRPTARISCSAGYSMNGGTADGDILLVTGFEVHGEAGETEVSGSCLANCNTITFNSTQNGGSGGWSTKLYKKTGSTKWFANSTCSVVRTAAITKPTKTNATFAGFYNTNAASGGTQFINSSGTLLAQGTVTAPTTLYAQYDCNTGYTGTGTRISGKCNPIGLTITLDKNGGSGILKTDESQTTGTASAQMLCYYNQPCTLPSWDDTNAEHRNNITNGQKIFTGWSTASAVREGDTGVFTMTFTANDVVYAVWIQPTCTVTGGHGTCTLRNASQNRPTAYFSCNTGYAQTATSSTTGWQQTGTAGATSVVDECVARQFTCAAGTYLNGTTCSTCQTLYYCPGGTFTYNGASQGDNRCPVTAIDQTAAPWHYASDPGAKAQTDCYVYGNAADFSDYCAAGQWRLYYDSSEGDYKTFTEHSTVTAKPGAYIDDSFHVGPTCTQCTGATYSAGGDVHSCTSCPAATSRWTLGTGTGWTEYGQCYEYRNATSISIYCASGQLRRYASSASAWSSTASVSIAFRADPGAYISGSGINMTCRQCDAGEYSAGGAATSCTSCPALTRGFQYYESVGLSSYSQCMQYTNNPSVANANCMANTSADVLVVQQAGSPTTWDGITAAVGVVANPGSILDSQFQDGALQVEGAYDLNDMCTLCGAGEYSPGGDITECISCPALTPGFVYGPRPGTSYRDCIQSASPEVANMYCTSNVNGGVVNQKTTDGVNWNVLLADGVIAKPGAYIDPVVIEVPGDDFLFKEGTYDLSNLCRVCPGNSYSLGGEEAVCTECLDNYTTSGTALTDHDSASDCKIYCDGGSYIAVANATQCSNVGAGYWAPSSTISQGSIGSRNACASGLTTIGFGLGANEAGDCGRVLNVGDEKIYLRSTKKTTPSLNISINGDVFYGNMSTATSGGSSLRINSGGATYRVYDDSNPALPHSGGDSGVD